jgi:hypothetical protein
VNIDAVEQGPADLAEILLDLAGRAAALTGGIAIEAAPAGVQIATATEYERRVPRWNGAAMRNIP